MSLAYHGTTEAAVTLLLVTKMLAKVKTAALKKKGTGKEVASWSSSHHNAAL